MSVTVQTLFGTFGEKELKQLKDAVSEINDEMRKIDDANVYISDIVDVAHQNLGIPKKIVKKLAVAQHKQNLSQIATEHNELEALLESINKV